MSKHTPGPWTLTPDKSEEFGPVTRIVGADLVSPGLVFFGIPETNANARLIAAAPDLLKVLKRIISSAPLTGLPLALELDIQDACTVIAQAEGK